ncbi:MAG: hypothetical protein NZO16_00225 [Deltaproteobacteria bacterium]|nr:hypothetical protein [Deltaproteobacteria bacterium]
MLYELLNFLSELNLTINWGNILGTFFGCGGTNASSFLCTVLNALNPSVTEKFTGSASSAVAAALATQGYYQQEKILDMISSPEGGLFGLAPLLYILSGIGGLIMLALGSPPKLYLWFLMGPALYLVFLNWTTESAGNLYQIGRRIMPQTEVQELVQANLPELSGTLSVGGAPWVTWEATARVSTVFSIIDQVISQGVQTIVNAFTPIVELQGLHHEANWYMMGDLRWKLLETITSARISQADIRDLLITFLSSECSSAVKMFISYPKYFSARNSKNSVPPNSVMEGRIGDLFNVLTNTYVPTPLSMKSLLNDVYRNKSAVTTNNNIFSFALSVLGTPGANYNPSNNTMIRCSEFLRVVMASIRAEAGYNFVKLAAQAPIVVPRFSESSSNFWETAFGSMMFPVGNGPLSPKDLGRELFGYWNLPGIIEPGLSFSLGNLANFGRIDLSLFGNLASGFNGTGRSFGGFYSADDDRWTQFFVDIITAYIFKNELLFAPPLITENGGDPNSYTQAAAANIATVGATSKFGEIYVWAKMLPKVQGLFLYWLAIGFPLAVVLMVIPNFHKALITWALFWTWVKSWDIGFVLIKRLEPTLWALVGKSDYLAQTLLRISEIPTSNGNPIDAKIAILNGVGGFNTASKVAVFCVNQGLTTVTFPPCPDSTVPLTIVRSALGNHGMTVGEAIRTLDLGLAVHNSLWLEEGNAFYLYLLAAMYFAVPVIMGQLILGSKAAIANMVKDFVGQPAGDAARAAGQAYSSQRQAQASAIGASFNQTEMLKNMREQGLAARAIAAQNLQSQRQIYGQLEGMVADGISKEGEILRQGIEHSRNWAQAQITRTQLPINVALAHGYVERLGALNNVPQFFTAQALSGLVGSSAEQAANQLRIHFNDVNFTTAGATALSAVRAFLNQNDSGLANDRGVSQANTRGVNQGQVGRSRNGTSFGRMVASNSDSNQSLGVSGTDGSNGGNQNNPFTIYTAFNMIRELYSTGVSQLNSLSNMEAAEIGAYATALSADNRVRSNLAQMESGLYSAEAGRLSQAANFGAQDTSWLTRANYANSVYATMSAYGVSPMQAVNIGEKPQEFTGAAWLGQLGDTTLESARLVDSQNPNSFFTQTRSHVNEISSRYGSTALYNVYNSAIMRPEEAVGWAYLSMVRPEGIYNSETDKFAERLNLRPSN